MKGRRRVAETLVALPLEGQMADLPAGQAGHETDVARVGRVLAGGFDGLHVEAGLAADLEAARVHHVCGRRGLRAGPALDDEGLPSAIREQDRLDHADRTGADDEEGNVDSCHEDS